MHLIQLLLPLKDNEDVALPLATLARVRSDLTSRFGGLTAYSRAPAEGLWTDGSPSAPQHDDLIVYEVVVEHLDRAWWRRYIAQLEAELKQERLHVRSLSMELL